MDRDLESPGEGSGALQRRRLLQACVGIAALPLASCGGSSGGLFAPAPPGSAPTIDAFGADTTTIVQGAAAVLQWSVSGATSLDLQPGIGTVTGSLLRVTPAQTTLFTLTATNSSGSRSKSLTVSVGAPTAPPPEWASGEVGVFSLQGGALVVYWKPVPMASGYTITVSSASQGPYAELASLPGNVYWADGGATIANSLSYYRVQAVNAVGPNAGSAVQGLAYPSPPEGPLAPIVTPPSGVPVGAGSVQQFAANEAVMWYLLDGPGAGTIDASGNYVAPAAPGTYTLAATGAATALVTINIF